ncbi:MAG: hypothetical protein OEW19_02215 [Acidobacteriota bacterium]|nr:hypothetical protein [Acidobacteriota bacterium]
MKHEAPIDSADWPPHRSGPAVLPIDVNDSGAPVNDPRNEVSVPAADAV